MRIGTPSYHLWLHRREQWDLNAAADITPLVAAHWRTPKRSQRVFCWWRGGLRIGKWSIALPFVRAVSSGTPS